MILQLLKTSGLAVSLGALVLILILGSPTVQAQTSKEVGRARVANGQTIILYSDSTWSYSAATPRWWVPENWVRLRQGMSQEQVVQLLGEPMSTKILGDVLYMVYAQHYQVVVWGGAPTRQRKRGVFNWNTVFEFEPK